MSAFRLVLVEDTEPDVFLVREALRQAGLDFELQVLEDGEKAIEFVDAIEMDRNAPRPDMVLLDLNLPKKSGGRAHRLISTTLSSRTINIFELPGERT